MNIQNDLDIRYSTVEDKDPLTKWLLDKETLKWFTVSTEKEVDLLSTNWVNFSKFNSSLTATLDNVACGMGTLFLMPYKKVAHHALFYIVVDPNKRKQGIGTSLVKNLINLSQNYFRHEFLHCEIYEGCPLQPVLEKMGFTCFANQEGFLDINGKLLNRLCYQYVFKRP
ncbi:MAG: N-acetyltransferase [Chlamydiae bacterium CG10_big_fil_rev_8_21_14_0_10_35_9]|nr:MAG: N-acetyltransferase [Chlamydiae bacterium CG10_big_fil_rev_8_21_14_0_10_35_9]